MDRGGDHLIRRQLLHQQAHRRHVRHGVHGAHLMEMDVRHRHAVDVTLRLGNGVIHRPDVRPHLFRHRQVADQMADLLHAAVVMVVLMVMVVVMVTLCMAVHRHGDVGAGDAALFRLFPVIGHAGDPQAVEPLHKLLRPGQQLQQGRRQHISGSAHAAVQIQGPHFFTSMWLIILARYPAPKPLSMFTTDTPLAQEFSMDSRADTPPKDAP